MVERLTKNALQKFMSGKVKAPATIAVKFYGNKCHYCHALKGDYETLADEYEDVLFYAFNIEDYPAAEHILDFRGVPTICFMQVGGNRPRIRVMPDPSEPDGQTWYNISEIRSFINKEKMK